MRDRRRRRDDPSLRPLQERLPGPPVVARIAVLVIPSVAAARERLLARGYSEAEADSRAAIFYEFFDREYAEGAEFFLDLPNGDRVQIIIPDMSPER